MSVFNKVVIQIEVKLLSYPSETELVAKIGAAICYFGEQKFSEIEEIAKNKPESYLQEIIKSRHLSIIEHNVFVFYISGISRVASHQLVRKRIASFSQQSQRYVNASNFEFVTPNEIEGSQFAEEYKQTAKSNFDLYQKMVNAGISKETARYVLPNATTTQLIVSMNAHALIDFFAQRCCNRSQGETQEIAMKMLKEVKLVSPTIFKEAGAFCDFYGYCPENSNSCGKSLTLSQLKEQNKNKQL